MKKIKHVMMLAVLSSISHFALAQSIVGEDQVHVFRVAHDSASQTPDGQSWENAFADISGAYEEAKKISATIPCEIWVKKGVYKHADTITLASNISLVGGFAGTETDKDQADPERNQSIVSGDVDSTSSKTRPIFEGDATSNGIYGGTRTIWDGETYITPEWTHDTKYWERHDAGGTVNDTKIAFSATDASNCSIVGMTFTCFSEKVFVLNGSGCDGFLIKNCRFLAATTRDKAFNGGAVFITDADVTVEDSIFDSCYFPIMVKDGTLGKKLTVRNSIFANNFGSGISLKNTYSDNDGACLTVDGCTFFRNATDGRHQSNGGFGNSITLNGRWATGNTNVIRNCVFEDNRTYYYYNKDATVFGALHGTVFINGGNNEDISPVEIVNCKFIGNKSKIANDLSVPAAAALTLVDVAAGVVVMNSYFASNDLETIALEGHHKNATASAIALYRSFASIVNSTFEENKSRNIDANTMSVSTICFNRPKVSIVHSVLKDNSLEGHDAFEVCVDGKTDQAYSVAIFNSVFLNAGATYEPIKAHNNGGSMLGICSSIFSRYAADQFDYTTVTSSSHCFTNSILVASPVFERKTNKEGVIALRLKADPAYKNFGVPVWLANGEPYFHDEKKPAGQRWRRLNYLSKYAASVEGLSVESEPIPDAFGERRVLKAIAPGPLNLLKSGFMLVVK